MNEKFNRVSVCLCGHVQTMFRHVRWTPQIHSMRCFVSFCPRSTIARSLILLSSLRFEKLCLQLYFVDFSSRLKLLHCLVRRRQVSRWWYCFSGALKSLLRMEQCSKFPWLSSLISCGHNFSPHFSSVGVSHYHLIVTSVYLFVFHRYPKMCVGFHLVLRENTCVVVFHPALVCAFEVWRGRDQSTFGPWERPTSLVCLRSCC